MEGCAKRKALRAAAGIYSAAAQRFGDLRPKRGAEESKDVGIPRGAARSPATATTEHKTKAADPSDGSAAVGGTAYGIRTRVTAVKGRRPKPLDERGTCERICPRRETSGI